MVSCFTWDQLNPGLAGIPAHSIGHPFVTMWGAKDLLAHWEVMDGQIAFFGLIRLFLAIDSLMVKAKGTGYKWENGCAFVK